MDVLCGAASKTLDFGELLKFSITRKIVLRLDSLVNTGPNSNTTTNESLSKGTKAASTQMDQPMTRAQAEAVAEQDIYLSLSNWCHEWITMLRALLLQHEVFWHSTTQGILMQRA